MGSTAGRIASMENRVRQGRMSFREYQRQARAAGYRPPRTRRELG